MLPNLTKNPDGSLTLLHPEQPAGIRQAAQLAARPAGTVHHLHAAVLAEGRGAQRHLAGAKAREGQLDPRRGSVRLGSIRVRLSKTPGGDTSYFNNVPQAILAQAELPVFKFELEKSAGREEDGSTARRPTSHFPISTVWLAFP